MRWLSGIRLWLRALVSRSAVEDEMRREMAFHVERETERLVGEGLSPDEARRRAMAEFGGVERFKEEARAERGTGWAEATVAEFRMALRALVARPAFTAVVVLTIAIGIGATTAVFSWANWTLFRPVPGVRDPGRVVTIGFQTKPDARGSYRPAGIAYSTFTTLAPTVHAFSGMAGYAQEPTQLDVPGADPVALQAVVVLGDYFGVLGVVPRLGRAFTPGELEPGADGRVAIISDTVWRAQFGAAPDVLGRSIRVNGEQFSVIGVAPPGFRGTDRNGIVDLWLPPAAFPVLRHQHFDMADPHVTAFMSLIGRLRPGVTPESAAQELNRRLAIMVGANPGLYGIYADHRAVVNPDLGITSAARTGRVSTVRMAFVVVALILLIACANVANLLLLRAGWRRSDTAVRRALGASAGRLVGRYLAEGLTLAVAGGLLGLGLAFLLARLFTTRALALAPTYTHFMLDGRVLAVAIAATVGTGLLFGIAPAIAALRDDPGGRLREGHERQSVRRAPARSALTMIQVGAATALVVGALLLTRTLSAVAHVDLGFNAQDVATYFIDTRPQGFTPAQVEVARQSLLSRVSALPGVQGAAIASTLPAMGASFGTSVKLPGDTARGAGTGATVYVVSPGFFKTLGLRIAMGASFRPQEFDDTTSYNIVVSAALARQLFGSTSAVGRQAVIDGMGAMNAPRTVIGVTDDVRADGPLQPPGPAVFLPALGGSFAAFMQATYVLAVRSTRPADALRQDVKGILASVAPGVPLAVSQPYADLVGRSTRDARLFSRLVGVLAVIAVLLAGVGLYSVIAFAVTERTREIGIRMALGATRQRVVGLVARQSAVLVGVGLVLGGAGAYALGRLLKSWLFGVGPLDPLSYVGAAVAWVLLAVLASVIPARAASRVDPTLAMRAE